MNNIEIWQVVEGKRFGGGKVLKTFTSATAALQAAHRLADRGVKCHARRYYADLHGVLETASRTNFPLDALETKVGL